MALFEDRLRALEALGVPRSELLDSVPVFEVDGLVHFSPTHSSGQVRVRNLAPPFESLCDCCLDAGSFWAGSNAGTFLVDAHELSLLPLVESSPVELWVETERARRALLDLVYTPTLRSASEWRSAVVRVAQPLTESRLEPLMERLRSDGTRALALEALGLEPSPLMAAIVTRSYFQDTTYVDHPVLGPLVAALSAHAVVERREGAVVVLPSTLFDLTERELPGLLEGAFALPRSPSPSTWEVFGVLWADHGSAPPAFQDCVRAALELS